MFVVKSEAGAYLRAEATGDDWNFTRNLQDATVFDDVDELFTLMYNNSRVKNPPRKSNKWTLLDVTHGRLRLTGNSVVVG